MKSVILWGAGAHSMNVLSNMDFPVHLIEGVVDSDVSKHGKDFFGIVISSPEKLYNFRSDVVLIGTDKYFKQVEKSIAEMGLGKKVYLIDEYMENYSGYNNPSTRLMYERENLKKLEKQLACSGLISQSSLQNAKLLAGREEALKYIPKNKIVAEIGVAYGDFSDMILSVCSPKHFYAIDYFNKDNPFLSFWGRNHFRETGLPHEEWYKKKYEKLLQDGRMSICSGLSWDCLSEFEDDFFDYIYIDACHDYESVKRDIEIARKKVKSGGIMQFNDYTLYDIYLHDYYGVVPAVNEFIRDTGSQVLFYCLNPGGFDDIVVKINK